MPLKRWSGYGRLLIVIMVSLNLGLVSWKPITVNSVYKLIKYCWVKTKIGRYPFQNCIQWQYLFLFGGWIELQGEISVEYDKKPEPHQKFTKRAIWEIRICSLMKLKFLTPFYSFWKGINTTRLNESNLQTGIPRKSMMRNVNKM